MARPIADVIGGVIGAQAGVEVRAYDGSRYGPPDADIRVTVASPRALAHLANTSAELGLARAFVSGDLVVDGDLYTMLQRFGGGDFAVMGMAERLRVLRDLGPQLLRPAPVPPEEVRPGVLRRGLRHARGRDASAIKHHYDVSNRFYSLVLGPSMAYTCAVFPTPDTDLEYAQAEKFDLVCRKLDLRPGQRLLDVGCGWGGMVLHAVKHYGVTALGVTLSRQQAEWAAKTIAEEGLGEQAEVRHLDYRDVTETGFDAVSSIGLTEHIGVKNYPAYFEHLHRRLRPGGRLLNHSITRPTTSEPVIWPNGFINRYVFPDGELTGVGRIISDLQNNGFEPRHSENLREHYALTLAAWCRNLDDHWDEAVAEVGLGTARVWALYMAASRLGFEQNRIQLHQVLAVRDDDGTSGMPLRPSW
ncbi:MAG TPA: cyclopropane-fatty-acyl-phospholipid synthase family protein [Mycobacteriales bacterium]|jgi:cyclopropane-fatty-acyl-phospholipid synthase